MGNLKPQLMQKHKAHKENLFFRESLLLPVCKNMDCSQRNSTGKLAPNNRIFMNSIADVIIRYNSPSVAILLRIVRSVEKLSSYFKMCQSILNHAHILDFMVTRSKHICKASPTRGYFRG